MVILALASHSKKRPVQESQVNEGKFIVKNKDGEEKRFKDLNSAEAKAWKSSTSTKKIKKLLPKSTLKNGGKIKSMMLRLCLGLELTWMKFHLRQLKKK